jgi:enoyl-CoA hydratase
MTLPVAAVEIMRMRLTPAAFQRGIAMAGSFSGDDATAAGWLDEIVAPEDVLARAGCGARSRDAGCPCSPGQQAEGTRIRSRAIVGGMDVLAGELDDILADRAP